MIEKWGYKLPCHPRDKAFRACYRACTQHCLIQDISYINCIEIKGNETVIVDCFKKLQLPNTGLSINSKAFCTGLREGELTLWDSKKTLGKVSYQWQPRQNDQSVILWIWAHTAYYNSILTILIKEFELTPVIDITDANDQFYSNNLNHISLKELKGKLSRFRLTGPLANVVIHDALIPFDSPNQDNLWLKSFLDNKDNSIAIEEQIRFWNSIKNITSVAEISPHIILSLIVKDPVYFLPKKRTKSLTHFGQFTECDVTCNIAKSPLMDSDLRQQSSEVKISTAKVNEIRSNMLVPGCDLERHADFVPVMLVQRPGNKDENVGR